MAQQEFPLWERYSSLRQLKVVVAYCLRFTYNCKERASSIVGCLSVGELEKSMYLMLRNHQRRHFAQEIATLEASQDVSQRSRLLCLNPFLDRSGLLRVGGSLKNASVSYSQKFPVILVAHDHISTLIIREANFKNLRRITSSIKYFTRTILDYLCSICD